MTLLFRNVVFALTTLFSMALALTIMFAGLAIMMKPERAHETLKNAAMAVGLFLLGLTLTRACFDVIR